MAGPLEVVNQMPEDENITQTPSQPELPEYSESGAPLGAADPPPAPPQEQAPQLPKQEPPPQEPELIDGRFRSEEEKELYIQGAREALEFERQRQVEAAEHARQQYRQPAAPVEDDPMGAYAQKLARQYVQEMRSIPPEELTEEKIAEAMFRNIIPSVLQPVLQNIPNVVSNQLTQAQREQMEKEAFFAEQENAFLRTQRANMESIAAEFGVPPQRLIEFADGIRDEVGKEMPQARQANAIREGFVESPMQGGGAPSADDALDAVLAEMNEAAKKGDAEAHSRAMRKWARSKRKG